MASSSLIERARVLEEVVEQLKEEVN